MAKDNDKLEKITMDETKDKTESVNVNESNNYSRNKPIGQRR